jgi:hypothetical protein
VSCTHGNPRHRQAVQPEAQQECAAEQIHQRALAERDLEEHAGCRDQGSKHELDDDEADSMQLYVERDALANVLPE